MLFNLNKRINQNNAQQPLACVLQRFVEKVLITKQIIIRFLVRTQSSYRQISGNEVSVTTGPACGVPSSWAKRRLRDFAAAQNIEIPLFDSVQSMYNELFNFKHALMFYIQIV
jgi:hypothetical protein